jgi:hypothetical protein
MEKEKQRQMEAPQNTQLNTVRLRILHPLTASQIVRHVISMPVDDINVAPRSNVLAMEPARTRTHAQDTDASNHAQRAKLGLEHGVRAGSLGHGLLSAALPSCIQKIRTASPSEAQRDAETPKSRMDDPAKKRRVTIAPT